MLLLLVISDKVKIITMKRIQPGSIFLYSISLPINNGTKCGHSVMLVGLQPLQLPIIPAHVLDIGHVNQLSYLEHQFVMLIIPKISTMVTTVRTLNTIMITPIARLAIITTITMITVITKIKMTKSINRTTMFGDNYNYIQLSYCDNNKW